MQWIFVRRAFQVTGLTMCMYELYSSQKELQHSVQKPKSCYKNIFTIFTSIFCLNILKY